MRFHIVAAQPPSDQPLTIDTNTNLTPGIDPFLTPWGNTTPPPVPTRFLSLNEYHDDFGLAYPYSRRMLLRLSVPPTTATPPIWTTDFPPG